MTAEERVKQVYPDAHIRFCSHAGHYGNAIFIHSPELKRISSLYNAHSRAWEDAWRCIQQERKGQQ